MNKVILMGRLTKDPETRYSQGGSEPMNITRYTLAVNKRTKKEGEPDADFIPCVAFGKAGEFAEKYFRKGMQVLVMGRLQIRPYDDPQSNQRRWYTDVILEEQNFTESKAAFESRRQSNPDYSGAPEQSAPDYHSGYQPPAKTTPHQDNVPPDFFIDQELSDDDLPF